MNVAVDKGAAGNLKFVEYVKYLHTNHYIPPDAKCWVDHIRQRGNEATHEIHLIKRDDAELLIKLTDVLLRTVYELPALIRNKSPSSSP
jgi:hypothetical protein